MCFGTADWQGLFHTIQSNQVRCCSVLLPLMWSRCVSISNGKDTLTTSLYWFRLTTAKGKSVRSCSEWLRLPHWACCLMEGEHERMGHTGWPFRQSLFGADVISHKKWWTYICWEGKKDRLSLSHTHTQIHPNTLTGLLLLGPARGFVGLTPDGDAVFQQLQSPALLPARRADLHMWQIIPLNCTTTVC